MILNKGITYAKWTMNSPEKVRPKVEGELTKIRWLLRRRRFKQLLGYGTEALFDTNVYIRYLSKTCDGPLIERSVLGNNMFLRLDDPGISSDILMYGVREWRSARVFEDRLRSLQGRHDGEVTVLDIGANIGYYVLLEARALGDGGRIYATEPVPENRDLLRKNIELNELADLVSIDEYAIGPEDGVAELQLHEHSNRHRVVDRSTTEHGVEVKMRTVSSYLQENDLHPGSLAVRMDVEGYEDQIVPSMRDVFDEIDPVLLFIELHLNYMDKEDSQHVLTEFEQLGFGIVSVVHAHFGTPLRMTTFDQLAEYDEPVELIIEK